MTNEALFAARFAHCYVCDSDAYQELLRKPAVRIFTDTDDGGSLGRKYPCSLNQCTSCGHVYEPVNDELRRLFSEIYQSSDAQGPTAMGVGQWGMHRAERLFFKAVDLSTHRSAVEIGCGDGFVLKALKERGFQRLIGIEPSKNIEKREVDGITFINDFVDKQYCLQAPVELAFSIAVFEHIEDIIGVLEFCRNNLTERGELFFVVPNAERQLEIGDPGLFIHQHVHYFTKASIDFLLRMTGFRLKSIVQLEDSFCVTAYKGSSATELIPAVKMYDQYHSALESVLNRLRVTLASERVIVHGACNSLNNITGWIEGPFALADNDQNKQGKVYFGRTVKAPAQLDLSQWDTVVVIPSAYFEQIRSDYVARGFRGRIVRLCE